MSETFKMRHESESAGGTAGTKYGRSTIVKAVSWPASVFVVVAHVLWRDEIFTVAAATYGGLLGALTILVWTYTPARCVPVRAMLLSMFYIAMGAPLFSRQELHSPMMRIRIPSSAFERATFACLVFALLALAASLLVEGSASKLGGLLSRWMADRVPDHELANGLLVTIATASVAMSVLLALIPGGQAALGALGYPATLLGSPPISIILLMYVSEKTGRSWILHVALCVLTLAGLGTGMLGSAALPGFAYCIASWRIRGRIPILLPVVLIAILIGLNSTKHIYRSLTWTKDQVGVTERAQNWSAAIERTYGGGRAFEAYAEGAQTSASRLSTLVQVAQVMDWVPGKVPFAGVELWLQLPFEFIPRALWADKPVHGERYNQTYTQTFKIQNRAGVKQGTMVTLPAVADGYWRAGWSGVAAEAVLFGILLGTYSAFGRQHDLLLVLLSAMFAMQTTADQHVFATLAGQPQLLFAMSALALLFRRAGALLVPFTHYQPFVAKAARDQRLDTK